MVYWVGDSKNQYPQPGFRITVANSAEPWSNQYRASIAGYPSMSISRQSGKCRSVVHLIQYIFKVQFEFSMLSLILLLVGNVFFFYQALGPRSYLNRHTHSKTDLPSLCTTSWCNFVYLTTICNPLAYLHTSTTPICSRLLALFRAIASLQIDSGLLDRDRIPVVKRCNSSLLPPIADRYDLPNVPEIDGVLARSAFVVLIAHT